ncbi:MAG: hypothetical protein C4533_02495 [Candidatus Omnitrophota bacterium]|jgi:CO dehydrogenase maturation factor|nr:MAG: hypothetical protein C4533_02495 [Candidatus Omnitrophota bacterium]
MSYVIAVAGKGGTGKTTLAGLIIRILSEKKSGSILAVDADPNNNLGEALGVSIDETIGSILDEIAAHPEKIPAGFTKDRYVEYRVEQAIKEDDRFDIISMGRPEGPGCYCFVNNVLRNVISKLISSYDFVVIDNEAGLEHFSRRTTRKADCLLVVSDPTRVGLLSAKRIRALSEELGIKLEKKLLVVNRSRGEISDAVNDAGLDFIGSLPYDNEIEKAAVKGDSLFNIDKNSNILDNLGKIGDKIWQRK